MIHISFPVQQTPFLEAAGRRVLQLGSASVLNQTSGNAPAYADAPINRAKAAEAIVASLFDVEPTSLQGTVGQSNVHNINIELLVAETDMTTTINGVGNVDQVNSFANFLKQSVLKALSDRQTAEKKLVAGKFNGTNKRLKSLLTLNVDASTVGSPGGLMATQVVFPAINRKTADLFGRTGVNASADVEGAESPFNVRMSITEAIKPGCATFGASMTADSVLDDGVISPIRAIAHYVIGIEVRYKHRQPITGTTPNLNTNLIDITVGTDPMPGMERVIRITTHMIFSAKKETSGAVVIGPFGQLGRNSMPHEAIWGQDIIAENVAAYAPLKKYYSDFEDFNYAGGVAYVLLDGRRLWRFYDDANLSAWGILPTLTGNNQYKICPQQPPKEDFLQSGKNIVSLMEYYSGSELGLPVRSLKNVLVTKMGVDTDFLGLQRKRYDRNDFYYVVNGGNPENGFRAYVFQTL